MSDDVLIRPYRDGDEAAILDCYNAVFPHAGVGLPPRTQAHWRWKFRDNPVPRMLHMLAEAPNGDIVGMYVGIPVRIWVEGEERLAAQGVDFCVLPDWRRRGGPHGLFVDIGRAYIDTWHGPNPGEVSFTYGWPVPAWRSGQKHLGYLNIRDWDCTFRELGANAPRTTPDGVRTAQVERFSADVDGLFDHLKAGFGLTLIRDQRYLNWRYADCPDQTYRLYECRDTTSGALRGIAVYSPRCHVVADIAFIVDWLHDPADTDAMHSMLAVLERQATADGQEVIGSFWNHVDPRFLAIQRAGYMVKGTDYFIVLATAKYETRFFRDQWYFTMGDSDLV